MPQDFGILANNESDISALVAAWPPPPGVPVVRISKKNVSYKEPELIIKY